MWLPGARGKERIGSYCLMGIQFQLGKMEKRKVLEVHGGDGCTTTQMSAR